MDVWLYICVLLLNVAPNTLTLGTLSAARPANNLALSRTSTAALEGLLRVESGPSSHPNAACKPCCRRSMSRPHWVPDTRSNMSLSDSMVSVVAQLVLSE